MNPIQRTDNSYPKEFPKGYSMQQRNQNNLIDPQTPSLPDELARNQRIFLSYDTFTPPPPHSTTQFFPIESGNCSPHLLRSTMYTIPCDNSLLSSVGIPLAITLHPFNSKSDPMELSNPVECVECGSYLNKLSIVNELFTEYICNICGYCNTLQGRHQALRHSTADYPAQSTSRPRIPKDAIVDSDYFQSPIITTPVFIFVLDASSPHNLKISIHAMHNLIISEEFQFLYRKFAVLLASTQLEILSINQDGITRHVLMDSLPFVPPSVFIDSKDEIGGLIKELEIGAHTTLVPQVLSNALQICADLSSYAVAGKSALILNTLPEITGLPVIIEKLHHSCNSINLFVSKNINIPPSINNLIKETGGKIYKMEDQTVDGKPLKHHLYALGTRKSAFGVSIEVKTSNALTKQSVYGDTSIESLHRIFFVQMDNQSTVSYIFNIDETIKEGDKIYLQAIINYTNYEGKKRLLVLNQSFNSSYKVSSIYNDMCFDTIFSVLVKKNGELMEESLIRSLRFYRNKCSQQASNMQLVIPDGIKLLPVLVQAYCKNLKKIDMSSWSVERVLRFYYPRAFLFTDYFVESKLENIKSIRLSYKNIGDGEIYIIENGLKIFVYIGNGVDNELMQSIYDDNSEERMVLNRVVDDIRSWYDDWMDVYIIGQGCGGIETDVLGCFVEDRMNNIESYSDNLVTLHHKILGGR
ncbi:Protein transport protein Sec24-like CEF [Astathelohania contejeani]|uniref:Protein transport protein Sec24-like CEF n=1 Tax=Astathelohania contejeani TaxID=164912 RepID=A0ABQ7HXE3_9MICR|nr:Protein transport protein Sec24-like CEF [Thelohania contejeani]